MSAGCACPYHDAPCAKWSDGHRRALRAAVPAAPAPTS